MPAYKQDFVHKFRDRKPATAGTAGGRTKSLFGTDRAIIVRQPKFFRRSSSTVGKPTGLRLPAELAVGTADACTATESAASVANFGKRETTDMSATLPESRKALHALLDLIMEIDQRYLGSEWGIEASDDVAEGMHALLHLLQGGLYTCYEDDGDHPRFRRIVSPTRKFTGDNADAIYFDSAINPRRTYRVRGEIAGAVYVSLTVESGAQDGRFGSQTAGAINDTEFDVASDGTFEIYFGGPARERNWLPLGDDAARITTRHYFERTRDRKSVV